MFKPETPTFCHQCGRRISWADARGLCTECGSRRPPAPLPIPAYDRPYKDPKDPPFNEEPMRG